MESNITIRRVDGTSDGARFYQGVDDQERVLWCYPSVTTILSGSVPTGSYLMKWIRDNGLSGQVIFEKAAENGTSAHEIIELLLNGGEIVTDGLEERVKKCVQSFIDWHREFKPITIATEQIVVNHEERYAGGLDYICKLDYQKGSKVYKGIYIIDWKTSSSIHDKHKYQTLAYHEAVRKQGGEYADAKAAIVHLGNRTKANWSFIPVELEHNLKGFRLFNQVYRFLNPDSRPNKTEYPKVFTLSE
jgi:hypothetical protein